MSKRQRKIWLKKLKAVHLHSQNEKASIEPRTKFFVRMFSGIFTRCNALLAQLVEQLTLNQWVQGSNPWECTSTTGREGLSFFPVVLFFCLVFTHLFAQSCVVNDILFAKILDSSEEKHYFCNKIAHKATFCAMCLFLHRKFKTLIHQYDQTQNSI